MYRHHTLEEKEEIIRQHLSGVSMVDLMDRFHVRDHFLYILFGRYEKYGMSGLERYKEKEVTNELKLSVIEEYEKDILPLWRICVEYDVSFTSVCRWVHQYKHGGYEGLLRHGPRGRPRKGMGRPRKKEPETELEKLRAENERLRTENALLKKVQALVAERIAREEGSGRKPSSR
jgi:transposase